jgi:predicted Rossmann-fold nucleotide-binding protein
MDFITDSNGFIAFSGQLGNISEWYLYGSLFKRYFVDGNCTVTVICLYRSIRYKEKWFKMPREGYCSITISDELRSKLDKIADKIEKSIPETIEFLVDNCKQEA